MKPTKCPAREKKNEARKAKKEGRRESEILLSAHARTSQADILHLDQKHDSDQKTTRLASKRVFRQNL